VINQVVSVSEGLGHASEPSPRLGWETRAQQGSVQPGAVGIEQSAALFLQEEFSYRDASSFPC